MKKWLPILILQLSFINFVSAYYYGGYGGFSIGDLLNEIDASTMILGVTFIVSFALLFFSLSRAFKNKNGEPNNGIGGIIALALALLITWGVNRSGFDFNNFFYNLGIPMDFLTSFIPIILLGAFIIAFIKWRGIGLIIIGAFFFAATFFVYEKETTVILGFLFIIAGAIIAVKWPKEKKTLKYWLNKAFD